MITVLYVDDDYDDTAIFCEAIQEVSPLTVCITARDGEEAINLLENLLPDMIFLDINMPKMNGYECLKAIKKMNDVKHVPVIIYSTSSNSKEIEALRVAGAKDFLIKHHNFKKLCQSLSALLPVKAV